MRIILFLLLLISVNFISQNIYSQIHDSSSGWSGLISSEGLYQSGNTSKFFVQGKGEIKRDRDNLETMLNASIGYGESKGKKDDNSLSSAFTADFFYKNTFSPFVLQYVEYSFAKGIDIRSQTGAGIKYLFIKAPENKSSVSLAFIYDYTNLVSKPGNYNSSILRLSFRLKTKQKIFQSKVIFGFTGFYQPSITDFSASNIRIETNLEIPVVYGIFARVNYLYSFEDVVSTGRKRLDNKLTFGFGIGFGER